MPPPNFPRSPAGSTPLPDEDAATDLPSPSTRREADDWALALASAGIDARVEHHAGGGLRLRITGNRIDEARAIMLADRAERDERARAEALAEATAPPAARPGTTALAYALALGLLVLHIVLHATGAASAALRAGRSQAALVLAGEPWRLATALTLHADLPHVVGNTLFGGLFLAAVAARIGLGLATLAFVATGTLGNLANALYHQSGHSSIGASTGIFGLVGVLAGLAAWRRQRGARPGRGAWVAFGAGLALLAMLGSGGPETDFSAHLFGFGVGAAAGFAAAVPLAGHPVPRLAAQLLAGTLSAAVLGLAWARALTA